MYILYNGLVIGGFGLRWLALALYRVYIRLGRTTVYMRRAAHTAPLQRGRVGATVGAGRVQGPGLGGPGKYRFLRYMCYGTLYASV